MNQLVIERQSEWYNRFKNVRLFVDGTKVGVVKNGEKKVLNVEEGSHIIQAKVDWCGSNKLNVEVNKDLHIELKANRKIRSLFQILGVITFLSILLTQLKEHGLIGMSIKYWLFVLVPLSIIVFYHIAIGRNNYLSLKERKEKQS